ncbi:MAG: helix-turn-helix domain-containing protein [Defluviitaleaceae bacterium]|nr:helix-turn-helix domain-containing protein [Defluviitaleaceae bacterium]
MNSIDKDVRHIFVRNLERIKVERNLSTRKLAEKCGISYEMINGWLRGKKNANPSLSTLAEISKKLRIPESELLKESSTLKKDGRRVATEYLDAVFGDDPYYAYGENGQEEAFSFLFSKTPRKQGEDKLVLHMMLLPLFDKAVGTVQRGTLTFNLQDGMCQLEAKIERASGIGYSFYQGFALILSPDQEDRRKCWCFLKKARGDKNKSSGAALAVMGFLLGRNADWKIVVAQTLSISLDKDRPVTFRTILSKDRIEEDDLQYYLGHMKMNRGPILIHENVYLAAKKYFSEGREALTPEEYDLLGDVDGYFAESDHNALARALSEESLKYTEGLNGSRLLKFSIDENDTLENGRHNANAFIPSPSKKHGPLLLSWLRKQGVANNHNFVSARLNNDLHNIHERVSEMKGRKTKNS